MTFSQALDAIKEGKRVRRESWKEEESIGLSYSIKNERGSFYKATQSDMFSDDWEIIQNEEAEEPEIEEEDKEGES